jgi:uncharacterized membrane protein YdcZ (DUF606 family)
MKSTWLLVAFICGAVLPFQAGLNAKLAKTHCEPFVCFSMFGAYWAWRL